MTHVEADSGLAWISDQWSLVASLAWTGYVDEGRGAVSVEEEGLHYVAGPAWEDASINAAIRTYNPRREVLLVSAGGGRRACHRLDALPCPPDAAMMHPVERPRPNERHDTSPVAVPVAETDIDPLLVNEPLVASDSLIGWMCPFCGSAFEAGDLTKWVSAGPVNRREYGKARRGLPYVTRSPWVLHRDCGDPKGRARPARK